MKSWLIASPVSLLLSLCLVSGLALGQEPEKPEEIPFWDSWKKFAARHLPLRYIPLGDTLEIIAATDPLESINRKVFIFNSEADRLLLAPVAKTYKQVTPNIVGQGIGNVFSNLQEVTTIFNDLLQGKFSHALTDSARLVVNSTLGIVGLFDVASDLGLEKHQEDFGQTLGFWDVPSGPYVMVPLFGPYTVRSGFGAFADMELGYVNNTDDVSLRNTLWAISTVHNRAQLLSAEELISGDRYTFIRDAYLQRREFLSFDGMLIEDDFGEDEGDDWDDWDDE